MRKFLLLASLVALTSCQGIPQQSLVDAKQQCFSKHPDSYTLKYTCLNESYMKLAEQYNDPDIDLMQLAANKRLALAKQVDSGEISVAEFESQMTDFQLKLSQEISARIATESAMIDNTLDRYQMQQYNTQQQLQRFNDARRY